MRKLNLLFWLFITSAAFAQGVDTVRLMHYNILNYRNEFAECDENTNSTASKEEALIKIIRYIKPSLITLNEVSNASEAHDSLMVNVFNSMNLHYKETPYGSDGWMLSNAVIYDSIQLILDESVILDKDVNGVSLIRPIDVHSFYYNNPGDLRNGDTVFIQLYVAHFKAGSDFSDQNERFEASKAIMKYHAQNHSDRNYIISGDLNAGSASELAIDHLVDYPISDVVFYDPTDSLGAWSSNSNYAKLHTQSTRSSETNLGCFSSGGLDDRFDLILIGDELLSTSNGMQYIQGSYRVVGNDGMHFNKEIKTPQNNSAPDSVISALYDLSDHLPVIADFTITHQLSAMNRKVLENLRVFQSVNALKIFSPAVIHELKLIDMSGRSILVKEAVNSSVYSIDLSGLSNGVYCIMIQTEYGVISKKMSYTR